MTSPQWDGVAGKRVVLTGGTNGIGLAAAEALAARGAQLALVARDQGVGSGRRPGLVRPPRGRRPPWTCCWPT